MECLAESRLRARADGARDDGTGPDGTGPDGAAARGDGAVPSADGLPPLVHWQPLDEKALHAFFPGVLGTHYRADDWTYMAYRPDRSFRRRFKEHPDGSIQIEVNSLGLREPDEVQPVKPDLRILVTGDSHVSGVVPHDENLVHLLGEALGAATPGRSVEALNAGLGGFNVYNYLGVLERFADLKPDVFVVIVYGGNDFYDTARLERYFSGRGKFARGSIPAGERADAWNGAGAVRSQEAIQTCYMLDNPEDVSITAQPIIFMRLHLQHARITL